MKHANTGSGLRLIALSTMLFVWCVLPVWTYCGWGRPLTEKLLTLYVLPVGLAWNLLILGAGIAAFRDKNGLAVIFLASTAVVSLAGNSTLGVAATLRLETRFAVLSPADIREPFHAIVMLGGCARRLPSGRVEVNAEGQRIVTTAELWHAGKTEWIITTGRMAEPGPRDASLISSELLQNLGVPKDRILRIPARNTSEEIASLKTLLDDPPLEFSRSRGRVGLVTSAFHMPRAMRLAESAGLDLVPLPSGHHGLRRAWAPIHLVPDSETINGNSLVIKEYLAALVGR